jgi:hypothetical protein
MTAGRLACEINWEDSSLTCADTGKPIESAYDVTNDDSIVQSI